MNTKIDETHYMSKYLLVALILCSLISCKRGELVFEENVIDPTKNGVADPFDGAITNFEKAKVVMQLTCFQCHDNWKDLKEQDYIMNELVEAGSPQTSKIIRHSIHSKAPEANMPPRGSGAREKFLVQYHQHLVDWVEALEVDESLFDRSIQLTYKEMNFSTTAPLRITGFEGVLNVNIQDVIISIKNNTSDKTLVLSDPIFSTGQFKLKSLPKKTLSPSESVDVTFEIDNASTGVKASLVTFTTNFPGVSEITIDLNGTVSDPFLGANTPYEKAMVVIKNSCLECHDDWRNLTEHDFIVEGIIAAGNANGSKLIQRSLHFGGSQSNMPPEESSKRANFIKAYHDVLVDWVNQSKLDDSLLNSAIVMKYGNKIYPGGDDLIISGVQAVRDGNQGSVKVLIRNNSSKMLTLSDPSFSNNNFELGSFPVKSLNQNEEVILNLLVNNTTTGNKQTTVTLNTNFSGTPKLIIRLSGTVSDLFPLLGLSCTNPNNVSANSVRKLSRDQYINSVRVVLGTVGTLVLNDINVSLSALPMDNGSLKFTTMDNVVTKNHIDAYYILGKKISEAILSNTSRLNTIATSCATQSTVTDTCINDFINNFGLKVWRRPLTSVEKTALKNLYSQAGGNKEGFGPVIQELFTSLNFTNEITLGDGASGTPDVYHLNAYELVAKAYFIAVNHAPDDYGLSLAKNGSVLTSSGYKQLLDYLFNMKDSANKNISQRGMMGFIEKWLDFNKLGSFNENSIALKDMAGSDLKNPVLGSHYEDAITSYRKYFEYILFEREGSFSELLTSNAVFATSPTLKNILKVPSVSSNVQRTPAEEARGFILQPINLFGGRPVAEKDPVPRGVRILRNIVCREVPSPTEADTGALTLPAFDSNLTTRERFHNKTSAESCMNCHRHINPFGFALEGFDVMGRPSRTERIYSPDDYSFVNELNVDDTVSVEFVPGISIEVDGGFDLVTKLETSKVAHACFAQKLVEYAVGDHLKAEHHCMVKKVYEHVVQDLPAKDALRVLMEDPSFKLVRTKR